MQLRVRWTETWSTGDENKTATYYGTIVGYVPDYYNRPCAVVHADSSLQPVRLEELEVLSEDRYQSEKRKR